MAENNPINKNKKPRWSGADETRKDRVIYWEKPATWKQPRAQTGGGVLVSIKRTQGNSLKSCLRC